MGEAIECVEEDQHFPLQWCLGHSWFFMKNSPITEVARGKKMYSIINNVKICDFFI